MERLIEIRHLKKYFPIRGGLFHTVVANVYAVDDVSFDIPKGQTVGLVGESGCGKTTLGRTVIGLLPPTGGDIFFEGRNTRELTRREIKSLRRNMQIIFQDPYASLNPRMTVREIIIEPLDTHKIGTPASRIKKVLSLLDVVGLRRAALTRYPHEFSGGQRQRIGIARALALDPKFIVADEPVSALDVSVRSQVLNLISDLQAQFGISFLFISHDLAVVQHICRQVGVMYLGRLVEKTSSESLYREPKHPYTQSLLSAIPQPDPERAYQRTVLEGDVPSPINPPPGCPFHPRCPKVMDVCRRLMPRPVNVGHLENEHIVSCHLYPGSS